LINAALSRSISEIDFILLFRRGETREAQAERGKGRARERKIYPKKYPEIKAARKYTRNSEPFDEEQPGGETNTGEQQQQQVNQKIRVIRENIYTGRASRQAMPRRYAVRIDTKRGSMRVDQ